MGRSIFLPSRLGSLGERRELPQQGPGRSPGRKRIFFAHLDLERRLLTTVNEMKIHFMPCTFVTPKRRVVTVNVVRLILIRTKDAEHASSIV